MVSQQTLPELKLTAVYESAPEGGYTCFFEEMPDVFSEGESIPEAEANLFDALKLVLEYHREQARLTRTATGTVRHEFQIAPA